MASNEKNAWDHANRQGENRDFSKPDDQSECLKEEERNPNKDADGYGSESARSDHSHYESGMGSRSGNNSDMHSGGSRGDRNYSGNSGVAGRSA